MAVVRPPSTGGGTGLDVLTLENRSASTIPAGYAVQGHASGAGCEAWTGARPVLGVAQAAIAPNNSGNVVRDGSVSVSATLTPGARYFCEVGGTLTTTPDLTPGAWIQPVGVALTNSTLEVRLGDPMQA